MYEASANDSMPIFLRISATVTVRVPLPTSALKLADAQVPFSSIDAPNPMSSQPLGLSYSTTNVVSVSLRSANSSALSSLPKLISAAKALTASEETAIAAAAILAKVFVNFIFLSSIKYFFAFKLFLIILYRN